jgi:predicted CoA-binding protein/GNAT superfamily N-acetyltransferase
VKRGLLSRLHQKRLRTLKLSTCVTHVDVHRTRVVTLVVIHGAGANEHIIAVGQYHALEGRTDVAEVSFLVEDAMQRRGIGTLLLDLLAEIARERGVNRFSADVLADNHVMLSVFRVSYGVTHLEFPISYSEIAESRAEAQEAEAERASLRPVLAPKSVAVIGASRDPKSVGGALFRNLIRWGFAGAVYPVNPRACAVAGVHAYASVAGLPEVPELVFITVPAPLVLDTARQCASLGVRALCVISAGFAETGPEGAAAQAELSGTGQHVGRRAHARRLHADGPVCGKHRHQLTIRRARHRPGHPR